MKLKNLQITNFRCFESLEMDLNEQLTVIVAKNGQGKSSILDAIRIGLWSFVGGFDLASNSINELQNNININDIRVIRIHEMEMAKQLPCEITLKAEINLEPFKWTRSRISESINSNTIDDDVSTQINKIANSFQNDVRNSYKSRDFNIPILYHFNTARNFTQNCSDYDEIEEIEPDDFSRLSQKDKIDYNIKKLHYNTKKIKKQQQKRNFSNSLFAYNSLSNSSSSYEDIKDWFVWIFESYREEQIKQAEKGIFSDINSKWKNSILVIQKAINEVLKPETGWYDLEYSFSDEKSLILYHEEIGKLKVEQLSDGIRNTLAMVGDIAYRCIKLNSHLGLDAAKKTSGIVMIDEIELHLHPAWQQSILLNLCHAFPNIQFIVTTHSPQVISTVASEQIRILDNGVVYAAQAGTKGAESKRILKQVFGVESRPQNDPNVKLLNEYLDLVYKDKWNEPDAKEKRLKLDTIYQGNEPALTAADLHIENRQWELENEENL